MHVSKNYKLLNCCVLLCYLYTVKFYIYMKLYLCNNTNKSTTPVIVNPHTQFNHKFLSLIAFFFIIIFVSFLSLLYKFDIIFLSLTSYSLKEN